MSENTTGKKTGSGELAKESQSRDQEERAESINPVESEDEDLDIDLLWEDDYE